MKHIVVRSLQTLALLFALAIPAFAEESKRGLYEGDLANNGGRVVAFVQGNHAISIYVFDTSGHTASFAGGGVKGDSTFSIHSSNGSTLSGTLSQDTVTVTINGQQVTLNRTSLFGNTGQIAGRFNGSATSSNNGSLDVKIIVDSQGNVFFIGKNGQTITGGFGSITMQQTQCNGGDDNNSSPTPSPTATATPGGDDNNASPSPTASASPSATASPTASPHADQDQDDNDNDDEDADRNEDQSEFCQQFTGTFNITGVNGETITGNLTFSHGTLTGTITINGVTYTFNADEESAFNHLANISTRGFVNTGQGQLIGGFIVRGGPKLVLIRALGPSLANQGVSPTLANPKLQLFQGTDTAQSTPLRENDDWQTNSNASDISKTTIAPSDAKESALLIRLEPGRYTTVVSGADGGTGIALVEIYEVDVD